MPRSRLQWGRGMFLFGVFSMTNIQDHPATPVLQARAKIRAALLAGLQASATEDFKATFAAGAAVTGFDTDTHLFDDDLFIDAFVASINEAVE